MQCFLSAILPSESASCPPSLFSFFYTFYWFCPKIKLTAEGQWIGNLRCSAYLVLCRFWCWQLRHRPDLDWFAFCISSTPRMRQKPLVRTCQCSIERFSQPYHCYAHSCLIASLMESEKVRLNVIKVNWFIKKIWSKKVLIPSAKFFLMAA